LNQVANIFTTPKITFVAAWYIYVQVYTAPFWIEKSFGIGMDKAELILMKVEEFCQLISQ